MSLGMSRPCLRQVKVKSAGTKVFQGSTKLRRDTSKAVAAELVNDTVLLEKST